MPTRIAVLASGRGSNARALIEYQKGLGARSAGSTVLVLSDRADAPVLGIASAHGAAALHLRHPGDAAELMNALTSHGIELVVLAGYLRLVPLAIVQQFRGAMINIHPALLPAFGGKGMYGARVHEAVIAAGVRLSGATLHFVDEEYDRGAIIAQWPVPVLAGDSPASLAARVLAVENLLLPRVVDGLAAGRIRLGEDGRTVGGFGALPEQSSFTLIATAADVMGRQIDHALGG